MEKAGIQWCRRFPGSNQLTDLVEPFRTGVTEFVAALRAAGATVTITQTYRPRERAYLMHWCCLIAGYRDKNMIFHQINAGDVPPMDGVDIDWTCDGDSGAARSAAQEMRVGFNIAFPAALDSRHVQRRATDMSIKWQGTIHVATKNGDLIPADTMVDLYPIGATYRVIKLPSDPPHWSDDGR